MAGVNPYGEFFPRRSLNSERPQLNLTPQQPHPDDLPALLKYSDFFEDQAFELAFSDDILPHAIIPASDRTNGFDVVYLKTLRSGTGLAQLGDTIIKPGLQFLKEIKSNGIIDHQTERLAVGWRVTDELNDFPITMINMVVNQSIEKGGVFDQLGVEELVIGLLKPMKHPEISSTSNNENGQLKMINIRNAHTRRTNFWFYQNLGEFLGKGPQAMFR